MFPPRSMPKGIKDPHVFKVGSRLCFLCFLFSDTRWSCFFFFCLINQISHAGNYYCLIVGWIVTLTFLHKELKKINLNPQTSVFMWKKNKLFVSMKRKKKKNERKGGEKRRPQQTSVLRFATACYSRLWWWLSNYMWLVQYHLVCISYGCYSVYFLLWFF